MPASIAEAAVLDGEAMQRAVGDLDPLAPEQLLDLGQLESARLVLRVKPGPDLLPVRGEPSLAHPRCGVGRDRNQPPAHGHRQRFVRLRALRIPAELPRQRRVVPHGLARPPGDALDGGLALAAVYAAEHVQYLPHADLHVGHLPPSRGCSMAGDGLGRRASHPPPGGGSCS